MENKSKAKVSCSMKLCTEMFVFVEKIDNLLIDANIS